MLRPYLKIWDWELIFGRAVKTISSPGIRSPCIIITIDGIFIDLFYSIPMSCTEVKHKRETLYVGHEILYPYCLSVCSQAVSTLWYVYVLFLQHSVYKLFLTGPDVGKCKVHTIT